MPSTSVPTPPRPGAEDDAGPLGLFALEPRRQAGLVHRLARRDEPELDVAVRPAHLLRSRTWLGVEVRGPRRRSSQSTRSGSNDVDRARRPSGRRRGPSHVEATSLPSAVTNAHAGDDDAPRAPPATSPRVIGRASRFGPWPRGRRRRAGRAPRSRSRRSSCRTRSGGSRRSRSSPSTSTSAHEAVGSPSKM